MSILKYPVRGTRLLVCAGLLLGASALQAEDVPPTPTYDDSVRGGDILGTQELEANITLDAEPTAPLAEGATEATGTASLDVSNNQGVVAGTLALELKGLAAGDYTVTVTSLDGATDTQLGTFTVAAENAGSETSVLFGTGGTPFPTDFNPLNIGELTITTSLGTPVFSGDFTTANKGGYNTNVQIEAGTATEANGTLSVINKYHKGRVIAQRLHLTVRGLPAKELVTVTFDGGNPQKVRTSAKGQLILKRAQKNFRPDLINEVEIKGQGNEVLATAHL